MESIAGELGVSKSAVSKALNGKTDISKELRDTILRKAKELHYSKAPFYHILVLSAARYFGKNGSYYQQLVRMLQEALGALGHTCELRRVSEEEEARGLTLSDGELFSADGLIVLGGLACERIEDLQALGLPILLFDYYTNKLDIDWVTPNDYFNAYTLTDFLIARGPYRDWLLRQHPDDQRHAGPVPGLPEGTAGERGAAASGMGDERPGGKRPGYSLGAARPPAHRLPLCMRQDRLPPGERVGGGTMPRKSPKDISARMRLSTSLKGSCSSVRSPRQSR